MTEIDWWKMFAAEALETFIKKWQAGGTTAAQAAEFLRSSYAGLLFDFVGAIEQDVALAALGIAR